MVIPKLIYIEIIRGMSTLEINELWDRVKIIIYTGRNNAWKKELTLTSILGEWKGIKGSRKYRVNGLWHP
jgi:hypothetical protein